MGSSEAAEFAKLAETTYRDVNIGLANQFAMYADRVGADIYSVIEACNSQPFSHIHTPGIAVGGHCIPVYPRLYLHGDPEASIVRAAREVNLNMPEYAIARLSAALGTLVNRRIAILGISYRGGVKESAISGVFPLVETLVRCGAEVFVHDPLYSIEEINQFGWQSLDWNCKVDAVIIQADHPEYADMRLPDCLILDGRNTLNIDNRTILKIGDGRDPSAIEMKREFR